MKVILFVLSLALLSGCATTGALLSGMGQGMQKKDVYQCTPDYNNHYTCER